MDYICRSNLSSIEAEGFSAPARHRLAGGNRKFPFRLDFNRSDVVAFRSATIEHMSISVTTSLHLPSESRTALDMFDGFESESFRINGFYRRPDFLELANRYGMVPVRAERMLNAFAEKAVPVEQMINHSFLGAAAKLDYAARFQDRLRAIGS